MNLKPNKKVFTLKESFFLSLKKIRGERATSLATISTVALSVALAEIALINTTVMRAIGETYHTSINNDYGSSLIAVFLFMTAVILGSAYLRTLDGEEEAQIMINCGASKSQILKIAFAESFTIGLIGGAAGSSGGALASLTIYGSQLGWPTWLLSPAMDYLYSIAATTLIAVLIAVSTYLLSNYLSLTKK